MKQVKVILIAAEIAALMSVIILAFTEVSGEAEFFKKMYLAILPCFAVVMQREQQSIEWNEGEEETV